MTYRGREMQRLSEDPVYFRSAYENARNFIVKSTPQQGPPANQVAPAQQQQAPAPPTQPKTQVRKTVMPALERAGQSGQKAKPSKRAEVTSNIMRNIDNGRVTPRDLGVFLDAVVSDDAFA